MEKLRGVSVGENIIRVGNYSPMDIVHGVRLDRANERLHQVEEALDQVKSWQPKSVNTHVSIPTEYGEKREIVYETPAMHKALANVVFNERQALIDSGNGTLADEILEARNGVIFEAKPSREEYIAEHGSE